MRVIINADDLGASQEINDAIFSLMAKGIISSSTILVNGPAFKHALERIFSYPGNSFGIHLNLIQYRPLTSHPALSRILDKEGNFNGNISRVYRDVALLRAIFLELSCQIETLKSAGIALSHLDSHHHVHTIPFLFPVIKQLQLRFGVRKVRRTKNLFSPKLLDQPKMKLIKRRLWNLALRYMVLTKTTSSFSDFSTFIEIASTVKLPYKSIELMTHPGSLKFSDENNLLESRWVDRICFPIERISYHNL